MTVSLLPKALEEYAENHTSAELPVLARLNRETNLKTAKGIMLSGPLQGVFLQMISGMIRPRRILELGTFTGYSAICLAQGLAEDGHLHTIELDEELEDMCTKYVVQAGLRDKITQHIGSAVEIIPTLNEQFDLVFIDADKINYERYYDLIFNAVSVGGYILADNVLYEGDIVLPENQQSKNGRAMNSFNKKIKADSRVQHVLLPLRDGMMMIRKISA